MRSSPSYSRGVAEKALALSGCGFIVMLAAHSSLIQLKDKTYPYFP